MAGRHKETNEFPDIELRKKRIALEKQIQQCIFNVRIIFNGVSEKDTMVKFWQCQKYLPDAAEERLPYFGRVDGKCKIGHKIKCVFSLTARLIMYWWNYQAGICLTTSLKTITDLVEFLNDVADRGLDSFQVLGNAADGYYLFRGE